MGRALLALLLLAHTSAFALPPNGSWEAWMLRMRRADLARFLSPLRPDKKKLSAPLPLWVDCHLSWVADHPRLGRSQKILEGVILRSNSRKCRGQFEAHADI